MVLIATNFALATFGGQNLKGKKGKFNRGTGTSKRPCSSMKISVYDTVESRQWVAGATSGLASWAVADSCWAVDYIWAGCFHAMASGTAFFHFPWDFNISSTTSLAAPFPPATVVM